MIAVRQDHAQDRQMELLGETLAVAVPMAMLRLAAMSPQVREWTRGQWTERAATLVGHQGDALMWPVRPRLASRSSGVRIEATAGTTEVFAALARGLAASAWQPGGVTWLGRHWCVDHDACHAAEVKAAERAGTA
jgi:hypothetical protein